MENREAWRKSFYYRMYSVRLKFEYSKFWESQMFSFLELEIIVIKLYSWNDKIFREKYTLVLPLCPEISWIQFVIF